MFSFSQKVLALLETAGWTPDRQVPEAQITQWVKELEAEGFTMIPEAVRLLRSFGGLKFNGWLKFDPIEAAGGEFDRIEYWEKRLNMRLLLL
jgi:hypothetical protein